MSKITYSTSTGNNTMNTSMNTSMNTVGDSIDKLPVDDIPPTQEEILLADTIFKKHSSTMDRLAKEFKDLFIIGALYVVLSLTVVDNLIKRIPIASKSVYVLIGIKACLIMFLFWIIKNFSMSKRPERS